MFLKSIFLQSKMSAGNLLEKKSGGFLLCKFWCYSFSSSAFFGVCTRFSEPTKLAWNDCFFHLCTG